MAEASDFLATERIAVVTGANKGIGLEICRQLGSKGIVVILTARDEKKGAEAIDMLKDSGLSNYVLFHQLDVTDTSSIAKLKDFIKARFGKLDILVNNAGILGVLLDKQVIISPEQDLFVEKLKVATQTCNLAEECIKTNYNGAKWMIQELLPLVQLSDSPRIVNVSSVAGKLENVGNEGVIEILNDSENLTEDKVDEVLNAFLKDFKEEGVLENKNWPKNLSAYILSKAAINAYTRILAMKYPNFLINCVCPGYVKTDICCNCGILSVEEGAESPVRLALLPQGGPSGKYFIRKELSPF